jgi:hypothetical protein
MTTGGLLRDGDLKGGYLKGGWLKKRLVFSWHGYDYSLHRSKRSETKCSRDFDNENSVGVFIYIDNKPTRKNFLKKFNKSKKRAKARTGSDTARIAIKAFETAIAATEKARTATLTVKVTVTVTATTDRERVAPTNSVRVAPTKRVRVAPKN